MACWSRHLDWWFATSVDRQHTFEGLVRHFETLGGVPKVARTDRMGCLGTSQGKRFRLHAPTLELARHHGVEVKACQAGDAKRKGKIERPFRGLEEITLRDHVIAPILAGVRSPRLGREPSTWTDLDRDYEQLRIGMHKLFTDLAIATPAAA